MTKMLFDTTGCRIDMLQDELFTQKKVTVAILRLDKIHPIVSGNKLFKLHYFFQDALQRSYKNILTFGGAYSNHLVATAYACKQLSLNSIGIVRGERPAQLSHTLQQCIGYGMELRFVSREAYNKKEDAAFIETVKKGYNDTLIIPEGGYDSKGAAGAAMIMDMVEKNNYSHIAMAVGTATTLAGVLRNSSSTQTIIAVPALKGLTDIYNRVTHLNGPVYDTSRVRIMDGHHFGGYAKHGPELLTFMNEYWIRYALPLDVVYTAKMLYTMIDSIKKDHFLPGSNILCIHTGGLQGNNSLAPDTLLY